MWVVARLGSGLLNRRLRQEYFRRARIGEIHPGQYKRISEEMFLNESMSIDSPHLLRNMIGEATSYSGVT